MPSKKHARFMTNGPVAVTVFGVPFPASYKIESNDHKKQIPYVMNTIHNL